MKTLKLTGKSRTLYGCLLAATLLLAQTAQGQVILYNETFNGSSADAVRGSEPDITIGSNTWAGSDTLIKQDGTNTTTTLASSVYLAMPWETNTMYELTLDVDLVASAATTWVGMGLHASGGASLAHSGRHWFLLRQNGNTSSWGSATTSGSQYVNNAATGLTLGNGMSLIMNIYTGDTLADTTIGMSITDGLGGTYVLDLNGASEGTDLTGINIDGIDFAGVGATGGVGTYQNYQVAIIPEPSASALLLGGLAFSLVFLRKRRRAL